MAKSKTAERRKRRARRHARVLKKVRGTADRPRLVVYRSLRNIEGQIVDDDRGVTLVGVSTLAPELAASGAESDAGADAGAEDEGAGGDAGAEDEGAAAGEAAGSGEAGGEGRQRKVAQSFAAGRLLAARALEKGIERVVFDRGGFRYHGRVKAFADGARDGGLDF